MSAVDLDQFRAKEFTPTIASSMPENLNELAIHLAQNINRKLAEFDQSGADIEVFGPDWARENSELAGHMHAELIIKTYGSTYALPNKDPVANQQAIESGDLDVYLMTVNGELTGTTCMVNTHDGRAELGRSASLGASGASIILDYRILDWLTDEETTAKYHTLFATLRNAPNRDIDGFDMRGGQAVTAHWRKFPGLEVNGFGPLYLKHGSLEQFSCSSLTRAMKSNVPLFVDADDTETFVRAWHDNYALNVPVFIDSPVTSAALPRFDAHYPPLESGITEYVHADIVENPEGKTIQEAIEESVTVGSPFVQVVVPIDTDTRALQQELQASEYQAFSYQPGTNETAPALVYGRMSPGVSAVETFWHKDGTPNPFWHNTALAEYALRVASRW